MSKTAETRFTAKAGDLVRELAVLLRVIGRKETIPVLSYVLAEPAQMGTVRLSATDTELALRTELRADGIVAPLLLPAQRLHDTAKLLPADADVTLTVSANGSVKVAAAGYSGELRTLPAADFVNLQETPDGEPLVTLPAKVLSALIAQSQYALAGQEQAGYLLSAAQVTAKAGMLTMAASDSRRLAVSAVACQAGLQKEILLPGRTMRELAWAMGGDGAVEVREGENHLFFSCGPRVLLSRKVEGKFPEISRITPKSHVSRVEVDRDAFELALRRVQLVATDEARSIKVRLEKDALTVQASGDQVGEAADRIVVDYPDGAPGEASYNGQFLLDCLGAFPGEKVAIEWGAEPSTTAAVLRAVNAAGAPSAFCVLAPMRGAASA